MTARGTVRRIEEGEAVRAPSSAASAIIDPEVGDPVEVAVSQGEAAIAGIHVPNLATVRWLDDSGDQVGEEAVEVVPWHYFGLDRLKGYGDGQDGFDELPDEVLAAARQAATEIVETNAERSFTLRLGHTLDWGDRVVLLRDNDVREVLTEGYAQVSYNQVRRTMPAAIPNEIAYIFGHDLPQAVADACLELAAYMLRPSNRPTGATGESSDAGYIHFTLAGRDGATDIPEVNAVISQFGAGRRLVW